MHSRLKPGFSFSAFTTWRAVDASFNALAPRIWDFRIVGNNPIPTGPLVVAANHFSFLDPVAASLAIKRPVRFLSVKELFGRSQFFDGLLFYLGVIPVSRDHPAPEALGVALAHLATGGAVGVFPEGRRVSEWGETPPKEGAAWLSFRTGAPLVPVALHGTDEVWGVEHSRVRRHPIVVEVGKPMLPSDYPDRAAMTAAWWTWMEQTLARLDGS